jgi:hypothetical protein
MSGIVRGDPCDCPPDACLRAHVEPPGDCINRLIGDVRTGECATCLPAGRWTWHHDGVCVICGGVQQEAPPPEGD